MQEITDIEFTPEEIDAALEKFCADDMAKAKTKSRRLSAADLSTVKLILNTVAEANTDKDSHDLTWNQYIAILTACKNLGVPYEIVDEFNQRDPTGKYNPDENWRRWQGLEISDNYGMQTLIGIGKQFGYREEQAPKLSDSTAQIVNRLNRLKAQPQTPERDERIINMIRSTCTWSRDKYGNPVKIKSDVKNYKLIFQHDPNLAGLFGRDEFRQETVFLRRAQWHNPRLPLKDTWDDSDDSELRLYLAENYAEIGQQQRTLDFIVRTARENSFHSIRNFFDELPKWDGTPRAETIFTKFLGADDSDYVHKVTRHFLLGLIARAFYPGCDYQSVVVLQGAQGIGKSRLLRMLGGKHGVNSKGNSWHIALRDQLDDSHSIDAMRKGWLVEIEEFAAASRADTNSMKGTLSADDVTRRFAYARRAETVKAHWAFAATCNDDAPLKDQTGNRRFLPIKCKNRTSTIVEGMEPEYIRQVWAEAYQWFNELFPTADAFNADMLRLEFETQKQAAELAETITTDDGLTTEIKGFVNRKIPPLVIWLLMTREERRRFHAEGQITFAQDVLNFRRRAIGGQGVEHDINLIWQICNNNVTGVQKLDDGQLYRFFGTDERKHICAAEVFNECFGQDNRKRMARISEVLSHLDGWHLGERLRNADTAYLDQKKVYYRN